MGSIPISSTNSVRDGGRALMRTRLIGRCAVCYDMNLALGPLAQLGERLVRNQEVGGSSPPRSTNLQRLSGAPSATDRRFVYFLSIFL
jgi:hypothetical protein